LKEIPVKINSVLSRIERSERNIAEEVKEWVLTTRGHFVTTECHAELQLTTSNHKKAAMMALLRMEKEGLVEKYGERRGCYRRVDKECEEIDFLNASTDTVPLELPFGIERKVEIMPGNIIVIAGEMNAGKTALL
ncbi:MAG: hypothetical protein GTO24_18645, partial [candidate division Zixibacteria bacterium]|nr:hypothetical protein [candidate division Zixibacteria bacterium]